MADIFGKLKANGITAGGHLGRGADGMGGGQRWAEVGSQSLPGEEMPFLLL